LYMDSIVNRLSFGELKADETLREELRALAEKEGVSALHRILEKEDPVAAAAIHENNVKRVIRAIEICRSSGMTKTSWDDKAARAEEPYDALWIGVGARDRETLYRRADKRVDLMIKAGLPEEVRRLWEAGCFEKNSTASAAIGYKEFFPYLRGESSLDACTEGLKTATRHYIKRQLTWLARNEKIRWFFREDHPDGEAMFRAVFQEIPPM
ncbi:MAG: tRNA (adenosine(37)-N6)-dimethylallyltransferase MiaA, partial [Ruminococcus sp.]|nr:tRNA (adenosine(37)-N6)-dimethylallyltransferase MiaA [Candidatus Apopatosoma intestinale]